MDTPFTEGEQTQLSYMSEYGYNPGPLAGQQYSTVEPGDDLAESSEYELQLRTIVQLADSEGTSITIDPPTKYEEVIQEFQAAWTEKRLMRVSMEREGFTYRVNPQQVSYIRQLEC